MNNDNLVLKLQKAADGVFIVASDSFFEDDKYYTINCALKVKFSDIFTELYAKRINENKYWDYCSFEIFKNNYQNNLENYINKYRTSEHDFIESQRMKLKNFCISKEGYNRKNYREEKWCIEYLNEDLFIYFFEPTNYESSHYINHVILNLFLEPEILRQIKILHKRKIDFLNARERLLNPEISTVEKEHFKIFYDLEFNNKLIRFLNEIGKSYSDVSFIYRQMYNDNIIHQHSESEFRKWLKKFHKINIDTRLQQLYHVSTSNRLKKYQEIVM